MSFDRESDHKRCMEAVMTAMRILSVVDLKQAISNADRALNVGPLLDPTLAMAGMGPLKEQVDIMNDALPLWERANEMMERELGRRFDDEGNLR